MQPSHLRITHALIASESGRGLRDLLEFLFVVGTIFIVAGFALREYSIQVARAQVSEILNLASTSKIDLVTYRAEYGRWPVDANEAGNATLLPHDRLGRYVATFSLDEGGVINALMSAEQASDTVADRLLSLRIGTSELDSGAPVVLVCGYAKPPAGIRASGENRTQIPPAYLPYLCKER
ncbi:MAG: pilin [Gammaproteobacteria bacterium]|nr:pilin [Gammaproteobacteria bacterium]